MEIILGIIALYTWIHLGVLSFGEKNYKQRTTYEKVVTWVAIVSIALYIIGTLS